MSKAWGDFDGAFVWVTDLKSPNKKSEWCVCDTTSPLIVRDLCSAVAQKNQTINTNEKDKL